MKRLWRWRRLGVSEWGWQGAERPPARLHRHFGKRANEDENHGGENSDIGKVCTKRCTDQSTHLHQFPGTESLPAGFGNPGGVPVKSGVVQTSRRSLSISGRSGKWAHYGIICGANLGAGGCKGANPASPGDQERPRSMRPLPNDLPHPPPSTRTITATPPV